MKPNLSFNLSRQIFFCDNGSSLGPEVIKIHQLKLYHYNTDTSMVQTMQPEEDT